jgi:glycosyltransferase involved in cell wall biosynthesis/predicted SAM-dependent methyltransferase
MPSVSVIVPNYNHSRYLPQRIESILGQTYQDFELILMDDCSTDDSLQILERYRGHPKVSGILYNQTNSGSTFRQWNKGVAQARGDYIWIAESDDWAEPDFLQTLIAVLENNPEVGIAYCQSYSINETNQVLGTWKVHTNDLDHDRFAKDFIMSGNEYIINYLIYKNTIPNASAVLFKKEKYLEVGGADESIKVSSDWRLWIKLSQVGSVVFVHKELNYYRTHHNTVRAAAISKGSHILEHLQMIEFILKHVDVPKTSKEKLISQAAHFAKQWTETADKNSFEYNSETMRVLSNIDKKLLNVMEKKAPVKKQNSKVVKAIKLFRSRGLTGLVTAVLSRIVSKKELPNAALPDYKTYLHLLKGKEGLEIGGPSQIFEVGNILPVYSIMKKVDGCNFSTNTVWEGEIEEGLHYKYNQSKSVGFQYICDATDLKSVSSNSYDFVLSSHSIEHIANPFKALKEWLRVLKDDGVLLMVVPHKARTFDHKRPITKFEHLLIDYNNNIDEHDLTHLPEILELHDLSMDTPAGDYESFKKRSLDNYLNRCLHHHVFDSILVVDVFTFFNLKIKSLNIVSPYHIIVIGQKSKTKVNNLYYAKRAQQLESNLPL